MQSADDAVTAHHFAAEGNGHSQRWSDCLRATSNGDPLVQEATRKLTPEKVNGEDTYRAESFVNIYGSHEAL